MEVSSKILRTSIHTFLQNYQHFTSTTSLLAIPFSASILLSQLLLPSNSSLMFYIYNHLSTLFIAAGFPSSKLFSILSFKVSQTIASSIFNLPFTLTFLLAAKASVIRAIIGNPKQKTSPPSLASMISNYYKPLLQTYIYNSLFILAANATSFCLLFFAFGFAEGLGYSSPSFSLALSAAGAVLFSVILANVLVISNMALTVSGAEGGGGYMVILKACVLLRGRTSMALFLALPANVGLAAIEALFQFRVVRAYHIGGKSSWPSLGLEGVFIAYLYSVLVVLDTIVSCVFYERCKARSLVDQEDKHLFEIEFSEDQDKNYGYLGNKNFEELP